MKHGYVRPTKWKPEKAQVEALTLYGVAESRIYIDGRNGECLEEAVKALRRGDELCVATACRLVNDRRLLRPTLDRIHEIGAIAVDCTSKRKSDSYEFPLDAMAGLANDRYHFSQADARRIGKKGGRPPWTPHMAKEDALTIWHDYSITRDEALKKLGVDSSKAYRWLGPRNAPAGRPRRDRSGDVIPPEMVVYFVRAGNKGPVKIGTSAVLSKRLSALRHPLIDNLKLLATVDGGRGKERELHKRFKRYHLKGEWFKFEGELAKFVAKLQEKT